MVLEVVRNLLDEDINCASRRKSLIIVLGYDARSKLESLKNYKDEPLTVNSILRSRRDVHVLFLNSLQYIFMYLIKLEVQPDSHTHLVIYGLDSLINEMCQEDSLDLNQVRAANLIFQTAYRVSRQNQLQEVLFIAYDQKKWEKLEPLRKYWQEVC